MVGAKESYFVLLETRKQCAPTEPGGEASFFNEFTTEDLNTYEYFSNQFI